MNIYVLPSPLSSRDFRKDVKAQRKMHNAVNAPHMFSPVLAIKCLPKLGINHVSLASLIMSLVSCFFLTFLEESV